MTTTLLVDGDIVAYRTACQKNEAGNLYTYSEATAKIDSWLGWLKEHLQADAMEVYLTGSTNFRRGIYPAYKDNRDLTTRPELLDPLKAYLTETYGAITEEGLEADDLIGLATWSEGEHDVRIIVSIDKDFKQIPGYLFNPSKADEGVQTIDTNAADLYFYTQWLTGDATDGYPGVPGVGPKKAEKLLARSIDAALAAQVSIHEVIQAAVLKEYEFHSLTKEFALQQARCARILRPGDYDHKTKSIKLWGLHLE